MAEKDKKGVDRDKEYYDISVSDLDKMEKRMCKMEDDHGFDDPYNYE